VTHPQQSEKYEPVLISAPLVGWRHSLCGPQNSIKGLNWTLGGSINQLKNWLRVALKISALFRLTKNRLNLNHTFFARKLTDEVKIIVKISIPCSLQKS